MRGTGILPRRVGNLSGCVELLRGNERVMEQRALTDDAIGVSFMSVAELYHGVERSSKPARNRHAVDVLLLSVLVVESDRVIAQRFGQLKTELWRESVLLPDADLFIAATTLVHGSLLVTGNSRHFARIAGLRLERWT